MLRARPLAGFIIKFPYRRHIDLDVFVDNVWVVKTIHNLGRLVYRLDVKGEVVRLEDSACFEPFDDTCLASTRTRCISPFGDVAEGSLAE